MNWLKKVAFSDRIRIERNIVRLEAIKQKIHELGWFAFSSQSGSFELLKSLLNEKVLKGRDKVHAILQSALTGENNSKLVLDSPSRFQGMMNQAEQLLQYEINKEKRDLQKLLSDDHAKTT